MKWRNMFSYYGSKSKIIHLYPKPRNDVIIEPFAGSARYSLKYFDREIIINDNNEKIFRIWKYLQNCSKKDILSMPVLKKGDVINDSMFDCKESMMLYGFICQNGVSIPGKTVSHFAESHIKRQIKSISENLYKIKHWQILNVDYKKIENIEATYFIDPPYLQAGYKYPTNNVNFDELKNYVLSRIGNVIVCEGEGADWLNFENLVKMQGSKSYKYEKIWTNFDISTSSQTELF